MRIWWAVFAVWLFFVVSLIGSLAPFVWAVLHDVSRVSA